MKLKLFKLKNQSFLSKILLLALLFHLSSCKESSSKELANVQDNHAMQYVLVLGIAQDAGYPQAGCEKQCCLAIKNGESKTELVSCIGIVDQSTKQFWIIDATPDFPKQLDLIQQQSGISLKGFSGIFLTHAHIGHYTGLMHLGREAMGAKNQKVYCMPRMKNFLENNGPWSQLVKLKNINIQSIQSDSAIVLNKNLKLTPMSVPHRDEYSETVGYRIEGTKESLIFIPDIDKWDRWDQDIVDQINNTSYSLLDGTFYKNGELPNRDMSEIPHPFIEESMNHLINISTEKKRSVHFIHLNHTNPLLRKSSKEYIEFKKSDFQVAHALQCFDL